MSLSKNQKINMQNNYEDIVREWYLRLQPKFLGTLVKHYPKLRLEDAENIYQDAFIAIQKNLLEGRIKENTSWSSYIMTIGLNLASKEMRHIGKTDSISQSNNDEDEEETETKLAKKVKGLLDKLPYNEDLPSYKDPEAKAILGEELTHTPEPCGSIIRMFYYDEMSMQDIALRIGFKNANTAKAKKSQCMKDLVARVRKGLKIGGFIN